MKKYLLILSLTVFVILARVACAESLDTILDDMGDASAEDVKSEAESESISQPWYPSAGLEEVTFEGDVTPEDSDKILSILTDDGSRVTVDGEASGTLGKGQDLASLKDSYRIIPGILEKKKKHSIKVEYKNSYHINDQDIDGCTLFMFPFEMKVTDRDDPKKKWTDAKVWSISKPIYSGESTGDMVSWKIGASKPGSSTTFTWTAEGPNNETITGPTGAGKNEWKIADGDSDTDNDWLKWKPGKWKIKVQIGSSQAEFEQEIGVRTDDIVVVGWIDPAQVHLSSSGVQSALTEVLPTGGLSAEDGDNAKLKAGILLKHVADDGVNSSFEVDEPWYVPQMMNGVNFESFSSVDKTYTLNWMFKFAGNTRPPDDFTEDGFFSQSKCDQFVEKDNKSHFKLLNHYQAKYLVENDGKFKEGTLIHLPHKVNVGNTKDPARIYDTWGLFDWLGKWWEDYPADGLFPGVPRENNSDSPIVSETDSKLFNEGTPDQRALNAFKNLTDKDQGYIWSSITFFSDIEHYSETVSPSTGESLTRIPIPSEFYQARINTQVYPTYWIYVNGLKKGMQEQASTPMALFPNTDKCQ